MENVGVFVWYQRVGLGNLLLGVMVEGNNADKLIHVDEVLRLIRQGGGVVHEIEVYRSSRKRRKEKGPIAAHRVRHYLSTRDVMAVDGKVVYKPKAQPASARGNHHLNRNHLIRLYDQDNGRAMDVKVWAFRKFDGMTVYSWVSK